VVTCAKAAEQMHNGSKTKGGRYFMILCPSANCETYCCQKYARIANNISDYQIAKMMRRA
jgi:hypothetical protein